MSQITYQPAEFIKGKNILLIGGTGTVGLALLDLLLSYEPNVVRIFSRDEYKQFQMQQQYTGKNIRFLIGDVRDYHRVERASKDIDVIFHLAAMKHVPACEYNPSEAVQTNVIGTQNVIEAAIYNKVSRVVFTSSDKAISPTNAMGATKLLAEKLMVAASNIRGSTKTIFSSVRFGNVLGSRGSVIPLFKKQILSGNPVTITNPEMTRFMMSIADAAGLTLKAAALAQGGETFVLKMPVLRLGDLVDVLIEQVCINHQIKKETVRQEVIGLRLGEKMYEELMTEEESSHAFDLGDMYAIVEWGIENYRNIFPKADVHKYTSKGQMRISCQEILHLLKTENLIP